MANNAENIVVGGNGTVYVATYTGSLTYPENLATAVNAAFEQVGYLTPDGASFTVGSSSTDIGAWQSLYPVRTLVTGREANVAFTCLEYNEHTIGLALGGGTFTKKTGYATYEPPAPSAVNEISVVIEWTDSSTKYRFVIPRGIATGSVTSQVNRTSAAELPITITANPKGDPVAGELKTQPFYLVGPEGIATT
jgi:hypothetical protein